MVKLVSSLAAREIDRRAALEFAIPGLLLMEEAGVRLLDQLQSLLPQLGAPVLKVAFLAGKGNNGGDALVMARHGHLRRLFEVEVVQVELPQSESAVLQTHIAQKLGIPVWSWGQPEAEVCLEQADLWVDGLWGSGLKGGLRKEAAEKLAFLVSLQKRKSTPVAAVDVPSGTGDDFDPLHPPLRSRWTLAAGWIKEFCLSPEQRSYCGQLISIPLGFPDAPTSKEGAQLLQDDDLSDLLPRFSNEAYKNTRGHTAVAGGSPGMSGALSLAVQSAAASGAGLVTAWTSPEVSALVTVRNAFVMVKPEGELSELEPNSRFQSWVVGPGWGRRPERVPQLLRVLAFGAPTVVDADGLWALGEALKAGWDPQSLKNPLVLTPHPGEIRFLGEVEPLRRVSSAVSLAERLRSVVVLKGSVTWILTPEGEHFVWDGQNPALGCAGSGDCLAGLIGGFLAQGSSPSEAARAGVLVHGLAGKILREKKGWFTADDLPAAFARLAWAPEAAL